MHQGGRMLSSTFMFKNLNSVVTWYSAILSQDFVEQTFAADKAAAMLGCQLEPNGVR